MSFISELQRFLEYVCCLSLKYFPTVFQFISRASPFLPSCLFNLSNHLCKFYKLEENRDNREDGREDNLTRRQHEQERIVCDSKVS